MLMIARMISPLDILGMVVQTEEKPQTDEIPIDVLHLMLENYLEQRRVSYDAESCGQEKLSKFMEAQRSRTRRFLVGLGFRNTMEQTDMYIEQEERRHEEDVREQLKYVGELN